MSKKKETSEEIKRTRESEAISRIKKMGEQLVKQIESGETPEIELPIRGASNALFDAEKKMIYSGSIRMNSMRMKSCF